jgi:hypothetical protein
VTYRTFLFLLGGPILCPARELKAYSVAVSSERMELVGVDRARYFIPTAICGYLSALCIVLIVTSAFLVSLQKAVAIATAGVFGLLLSAGLGLLFWRAQRMELRYRRVPTTSDAYSNFELVSAAAQRAGWRVLREEPGRRLDAQACGSILNVGERIAVQFCDSDVLVASICDPSVGFSLVGRRHCEEHRQLVRRAVLCGRTDAVDPEGRS